MIRKIKTKEEIKGKTKKNQIIVGIILIGLMVLSTVGYSFLSNEESSQESEKYNQYEFIRVNNLWKLSNQDLYFQNLPQDVKNISATGYFVLGTYNSRPLYVVNNNPSFQQILINLKTILRYQEACLVNETCANEDFPRKTCDDNVIIYGIGNETKVWQDKNCVYISGDFAVATDAFLYRLFGII